ncbi:MAG: acyl-CoA thioesterase [Deltaproteobacteria bacterium]|nr:acyl-CoA thioesterase [Deltaproteobacteria bacterium]
MGVVYNANYLRWFEIGRTEMLRQIGLIYRDLEQSGYYLPVTEAYCHYLSPARYDDLIIVQTTIAFLRHASIKFDYRIWDEVKDRLIAEGYTRHAFIDESGKIARVPQNVKEYIKKRQAKGV